MENDNQKEDITPSEDKTKEIKDEGTDKEPETIDYKAELEKSRKQLGQAEHLILQLKSKKDKEAEEDDEEETSTLDEKRVEEIAERKAAKMFIGLSESQAKNYARSISVNEDEAELILFHYKNSISPTGDIERDIKRAKLIANEARIDKDLEQARRAALSKNLKETGGGEGGQKQPVEEGPPALSPEDQKVLQGFTWDAKRKGLVGPSGRFHPWPAK